MPLERQVDELDDAKRRLDHHRIIGLHDGARQHAQVPEGFEPAVADNTFEAKLADRQAQPAERPPATSRPIQLRVIAALGTSVGHGRSNEISVNGASLRLDTMLPAGRRMQLRFLSPSSEHFDCLDVGAEVLYSIMTSGSPACRVGVKFVGADAEFRRRLQVVLQR